QRLARLAVLGSAVDDDRDHAVPVFHVLTRRLAAQGAEGVLDHGRAAAGLPLTDVGRAALDDDSLVGLEPHKAARAEQNGRRDHRRVGVHFFDLMISWMRLPKTTRALTIISRP